MEKINAIVAYTISVQRLYFHTLRWLALSWGEIIIIFIIDWTSVISRTGAAPISCPISFRRALIPPSKRTIPFRTHRTSAPCSRALTVVGPISFGSQFSSIGRRASFNWTALFRSWTALPWLGRRWRNPWLGASTVPRAPWLLTLNNSFPLWRRPRQTVKVKKLSY